MGLVRAPQSLLHTRAAHALSPIMLALVQRGLAQVANVFASSSEYMIPSYACPDAYILAHAPTPPVHVETTPEPIVTAPATAPTRSAPWPISRHVSFESTISRAPTDDLAWGDADGRSSPDSSVGSVQARTGVAAKTKPVKSHARAARPAGKNVRFALRPKTTTRKPARPPPRPARNDDQAGFRAFVDSCAADHARKDLHAAELAAANARSMPDPSSSRETVRVRGWNGEAPIEVEPRAYWLRLPPKAAVAAAEAEAEIERGRTMQRGRRARE